MRTILPVLACALVLLAVRPAPAGRAGAADEPDRQIAEEVFRIKAIDHHAHPLRATREGEEDREYDALPPDALEAPPPLPVRSLEPVDEDARSKRTIATVAVFILYGQLIGYRFAVATGVVEEKSTRVVEVLLAAVRPVQLLAGKVVGIGVLAIGHAALMAGSALLAARASGAGSLPSGSAEAIVMTVLWFAIGYALYCTVFAAMGSLISRSEEIQNVSFPVQVPLLVGYFIATVALSDGNPTTVLRIFAFVPLTAPMCMPVLRAIGAAPLWQVALSMALTIAATVATARIASGIYRRAILRTGRRLRLREVLRPA